MFRILAVISIAVAALALVVAPAQADNLFVCQSCTTAPGAPTLLTNLSSFNVGDAGMGGSVGPLLIIVGTYNGAPAPTLSFGSNTYTPGGAAIYGWNGSSTGVTFNSASGSTDAYTEVGIAPEGGGSSEQFGNWNGSEGLAGNGITPAMSFTLYVYELTGVTLPSMGTISLDMTGGTNGSFVIGYACQEALTSCSPPLGHLDSTPFTTSGIVDSMPEPSSLLLLGTGVLGLLGFARRRFQNS